MASAGLISLLSLRSSVGVFASAVATGVPATAVVLGVLFSVIDAGMPTTVIDTVAGALLVTGLYNSALARMPLLP